MSRRRKILVISLASCAFLLLLGFFTRYLFLPEYRPGISAEEVYGLDVSNHQGVIDWQAVKQDNIDAVYIKSSEGGDWTDQRFADNWVEAKKAGRIVLFGIAASSVLN